MNVLLDILPMQWQVVWVTQHGREAALNWCHDRGDPRIQIVSELSGTQLQEMSAAVVATSPHTHADFVKRTLTARSWAVPV